MTSEQAEKRYDWHQHTLLIRDGIERAVQYHAENHGDQTFCALEIYFGGGDQILLSFNTAEHFAAHARSNTEKYGLPGLMLGNSEHAYPGWDESHWPAQKIDLPWDMDEACCAEEERRAEWYDSIDPKDKAKREEAGRACDSFERDYDRAQTTAVTNAYEQAQAAGVLDRLRWSDDAVLGWCEHDKPYPILILRHRAGDGWSEPAATPEDQADAFTGTTISNRIKQAGFSTRYTEPDSLEEVARLAGLIDGPMPDHFEPWESHFAEQIEAAAQAETDHPRGDRFTAIVDAMLLARLHRERVRREVSPEQRPLALRFEERWLARQRPALIHLLLKTPLSPELAIMLRAYSLAAYPCGVLAPPIGKSSIALVRGHTLKRLLTKAET